jgi:hypothetical protein
MFNQKISRFFWSGFFFDLDLRSGGRRGGLEPLQQGKIKVAFLNWLKPKSVSPSSGTVPLNQIRNILTRGYYIIILKKFFPDSIDDLSCPGLGKSSPC